jgi:DNA-binding NarL/FixJ family response regulator
MNNLKCLKEKFPGKPILIFTGEDSLEWRKKMMHAGVNGYICKTADPCEIKRAIEKIIEHGTYFPSVSPDIQYKWKNPLNHTEQRITVLLSEGFRLLAIAKKVHLSVTAVEKTLAKLRKEYQCANNTMLIMVLTEKYYL